MYINGGSLKIKMVTTEEALKIIKKNISPMDWEEIDILKVWRRVLGEDIYATRDVPLWDNSAMDGYALRYQDTKGASLDNPIELKVIGMIKAGGFSDNITLGEKEAIKIMTGAHLPALANAVIKVEDTQEDGKGRVKIYKEIKKGENVRIKGEDIKKNSLLLLRGTRILAAQWGLLVSVGIKKVRVYKRPKVAIIATGDEIVDIKDEEDTSNKILSSNTYTISAQLLNSGAVPINL